MTKNTNPFEIAKEIFPDYTDKELEYVIWEHTGYPCFFKGDPVECFTNQLLAISANHFGGISK